MAEETTQKSEPRGGRSLYDDYDNGDRSRLGPTDDDAEAWADRERRRREQWLQGPTEDEKIAWARKERRRRRSDGGEDAMGLGPTDEEVDAWADRERRRREQWLQGPTEDEKVAWARKQRRGSRSRYGDDAYCSPMFVTPDDVSEASRLAREAAERTIELLVDLPYRALYRAVRSGRDFVDEELPTLRSRRVRYYDDD